VNEGPRALSRALFILDRRAPVTARLVTPPPVACANRSPRCRWRVRIPVSVARHRRGGVWHRDGRPGVQQLEQGMEQPHNLLRLSVLTGRDLRHQKHGHAPGPGPSENARGSWPPFPVPMAGAISPTSGDRCVSAIGLKRGSWVIHGGVVVREAVEAQSRFGTGEGWRRCFRARGQRTLGGQQQTPAAQHEQGGECHLQQREHSVPPDVPRKEGPRGCVVMQ
jgi:hypothetical protein